MCKAWHLDFHSVLWERSSYKVLNLSPGTPEERAKWLDIVSLKAHLFRHIYHQGSENFMMPEIRDILLDRCHGLITIEAHIDSIKFRTSNRYWEEVIRPLIERNKASLRRLQLQQFWSTFITDLHLPSLLAGLPRLKSLELRVSGMVFMEELFPIFEACPASLECFDLNSRTVKRKANQDYSSTNPQSSLSQSLVHQAANPTPHLRLKHVRIHSICHDGTLADILSHVAVHSLETLLVKEFADTPFPRQVSPTLRDILSRLTDLDINSLSNKRDPFVLMFFSSIPPHQLRKVHFGTVDADYVVVLIQQQHQSLESLKVKIQGHAGVVGDILATCSKLKTLDYWSIPYVDIRTLIDPQRPWVCTELEVFEGCFGLSPPPPLPLAMNEYEEDDQVTISNPPQIQWRAFLCNTWVN